MERIKLSLILLLPLIMAVSCGSEPRAEDTDPPVEIDTISVDITPAAPVKDTAFDPHSISQEVFNATKIDVQHFVEKLNHIIRSKNFTAWKEELSPSFFEGISSGQFLQQVSESDALKTRGIVIKTVEDYFNNVVVPSRANSRLDDIEFVSQNRVKAYTIVINREGQAQRLRLYDLEYTGNLWKIIN